MVHRIEMDELISCNEDSCFMEAAYDYMIHTSEKAKAIHGALVEASEKLYRALPEEAHPRQEALNGVFAELEDLTFLCAHGCGLLLASKMALRAALPPLTEGLNNLIGIPTLYQNPHFVEARTRVEQTLRALKDDFPACGQLVDRVITLNYDLFGRQIGYDFLIGLEYGMTLYKMMDALKQEDEPYIAQIYRLVEETTPLEEGFGR